MDDRRIRLVHPFPPVWDGNSRLLVLGSFPSVKSREDGFYYGNRSNRFWPVMEGIFGERLCTRDEKISFLLSHSIALWDSIASCTIVGSSDASILDAVPNDIPFLMKHSRIERIAANGSRAYELKRKGKDVELTPKNIHIDSIELTDFDEETMRMGIRVNCGKGTYIRALARDIGRALGSGAYLTTLCRTRVGEFTIDRCLNLDEVEEWLENQEIENIE